MKAVPAVDKAKSMLLKSYDKFVICRRFINFALILRGGAVAARWAHNPRSEVRILPPLQGKSPVALAAGFISSRTSNVSLNV